MAAERHVVVLQTDRSDPAGSGRSAGSQHVPTSRQDGLVGQLAPSHRVGLAAEQRRASERHGVTESAACAEHTQTPPSLLVGGHSRVSGHVGHLDVEGSPLSQLDHLEHLLSLSIGLLTGEAGDRGHAGVEGGQTLEGVDCDVEGLQVVASSEAH